MTTSRVNVFVKPLRNQWRDLRAAEESAWPTELWEALVRDGGCRWGIRRDHGGEEWTPTELLDTAVELTRGDLTAAFVWTQFLAATQRLEKAPQTLQQKWLPRLARGEAFATVGISHLTTSRQHWKTPTVCAIPSGDGYRITGSIPWVTGLTQADVIVAGATVDDGRQLLFALDTTLQGVERGGPLPLLALRGSMTGSLELHDVLVSTADIIAGPVESVLKAIGSGGAGSFMTSAVAIGHALGSLDHLDRLTAGRVEFDDLKQSWKSTLRIVRDEILTVAEATASAPQQAESLRVKATTLALQLSQALLTASKGAGFVQGHPAERLVREALFFLVWSCPQAVAGELLRGFAGQPRDCSPGAFP